MIFTISIKFLKRKFDNKMTCIKKEKIKYNLMRIKNVIS